MSIVQQKQQLRTKMRQARRALSDAQQQTYADQLSQVFCDFIKADDAPLSLYLSFDGELNTQGLINHCWDKNLNVYLPIVGAQNSAMNFTLYQPDSVMTHNRYDILEPLGEQQDGSQLRTIFLPLTAFDKAGQRLGMGAGYYDRTLAKLTSKPKLVGLAYDFQEVANCPTDEFDQKLDWILTPEGVIKA